MPLCKTALIKISIDSQLKCQIVSVALWLECKTLAEGLGSILDSVIED